jgi:vacuolar-type H+-ATPase subunit E/Vma4
MEPETQRIIDRIFQDANEKAESILTKAQKSAEMLLDRQKTLARQKAEEDEFVLLKKAESEIETIRGKAVAEAKRKAGWMILSEKELWITNVLNEVKNGFNALSKSEKYLRIIENMIVDAGTAIGGGELEVMVSCEGSSLPLNMKTLAESISKKTSVKTQLKLLRERTTPLGVIVRTADGRIIVENTFEAILKRGEKEQRLKIAKVLFKD